MINWDMPYKRMLVKVFVRLIPKIFKREIIRQFKKQNHYEYLNISYSQEGEDLILKRYFGDIKNLFFVDVGAYHPFRFSNTYLFYKNGGNGINIEPTPGTKILFDKYRPRDINLEIGVGISEEEIDFYMFNEPALNTFSKNEAKKKSKLAKYRIVEKKKIKVKTLTSILDQYLPSNQVIDFLSIDVEGKDLEVLESNDWKKYRPVFVVIEDLNQSSELDSYRNELFNRMDKLNYQFIAKTFNSVIYRIKK